MKNEDNKLGPSGASLINQQNVPRLAIKTIENMKSYSTQETGGYELVYLIRGDVCIFTWENAMCFLGAWINLEGLQRLVCFLEKEGVADLGDKLLVESYKERAGGLDMNRSPLWYNRSPDCTWSVVIEEKH